MRWFVVVPLRWALGLLAFEWLADVLPRVRLKPITGAVVWDWILGGGLPGMKAWQKKSPEEVDPSGPAV